MVQDDLRGVRSPVDGVVATRNGCDGDAIMVRGGRGGGYG